MGATYTRQSNFTDGDVITADLFNNEFDQLLAALASSTGHTHDGTTAEGGPITKLLGDTVTLGTAAGDISLVFDGGSNDGTLKWMEDEDYFEFSDDILMATTEKIQFTNTSNYIHSASAGNIDVIAATEIHLTATTINMDGAADISGNLDVGGNLVVTGTTTFNGGTLTLGGDASDNVVFGGDVNSSIIPNGVAFDLGSSTQEWRDLFINGTAHIDTLDVDENATITGTLNVTDVATVGGLTIGNAVITEAELEILDGANVTTAELNIIDGGTSATSTTVADADRVVLNDNGTMVQVAVTDLAAYFDDEITAMPNLITTAATTVGALNSGSITSGFGTIDTGSSSITTTGLISGGSLDIDNVLINGTTIGHTDDTDLITLANGVVTVAGEVSMTTLDIGGTNVTSTATELNLLDGVTGLVQADFTKLAAVNSTADELNIVDGGTSATSTTVVDADRVVLNDNGTMVQVAVTDLAAYFDDEITAMPNLVTTAATTVGVLNSGSITSGFGTIDTGSSTITTTGLISGGSLDIDNVLINGTTIGHTDDTDLITLADGIVTVAGEVSLTTLDIGGTNVTSTAAELNVMDGGTSATSTSVADADRLVMNDNGTMVQVAVTDLAAYLDDEITAMPNLVTTAATTVGALDSGSITSGFGTIDTGASTITTTGLITGGSLTVDDVGVNGKVITMTGSTSDTATFTVGTNGTLDIATTDDNAAAANIQITADGTAELAGTTVTLDSSGGITLNADSGTITFADDSSSLGTITSSGYSGTSATVTVTDSTANTNFPVVFHNESDALLDDTGALRYNPSTGTLLAPNLVVAGTTTTVDTVTMNAANAVIFEGATADNHETTLSIVDPTADRTINLPNQSGTIPVLAAASNTAVTSTPEELNIMDGGTSATSTTIVDADRLVLNDNATMVQVAVTDVDTYVSGTTKTLTNKTLTSPKINEDVAVTSTATELNLLDGVTATTAELNILDGVTSTAAELNALDGITAVVGELNALDIGSTAVGTAVASKAVILDSNKDYTGIRNLTITGELDAATLDLSGNADIAGTLTQTGLATLNAGLAVKNGATSAGLFNFLKTVMLAVVN